MPNLAQLNTVQREWIHDLSKQEVLKLHLNSRKEKVMYEKDKMVIPLSAVNHFLFWIHIANGHQS